MKAVLSFSYNDIDRVRLAAKALLSSDLDVWYCDRDNRVGPLAQTIEKQIESADCLIVFASQNVKWYLDHQKKERGWVLDEFAWACKLGLKILPVLLDDVDLGDKWLNRVREPHLGDHLSVSWPEGIPVGDLVSEVRKILGYSAPPAKSEVLALSYAGASIPKTAMPLLRTRPKRLVSEDLRRWGSPDGGFDEDVRLLSRNPLHLSFLVDAGAIQLHEDKRAGHFLDQIKFDGNVLAQAAALGGNLDATAIKAFLDHLAQHRAEGRPLVEDASSSEALTNLRATLLVLAITATQDFLASCSAASSPMETWARQEMPSRLAGRIHEVLRLVVTACSAVDPALHPLLGVESIIVRLEELERDVGPGGDSTIDGAVVEWFTDLLWHSLIFDSPMYPRVEELAIQVSLTQHDSVRRPFRQMEPVESLYCDNPGQFAASARAAVQRGYIPNEVSSRRDFFCAMADALAEEHIRWVKRRSGQQASSFALALTANLDLELERSLSAQQICYHVGVPVILTMLDTAGGEWKEELRWLVGDFGGVESEDLSTIAQPLRPWRWIDALATGPAEAPKLKGPLILKLGGSPLHFVPEDPSRHPKLFDIPEVLSTEPEGDDLLAAKQKDAARKQPSRDGKSNIILNHALSLGEVNVLNFTRFVSWALDVNVADGRSTPRTEGLPPFVCGALADEERYWLLTGYRTSDWNRRTLLWTLLSLRQGPGASVALNYDADRARVLGYLGLSRVEGNCHDLVALLRRVTKRLQNDR